MLILLMVALPSILSPTMIRPGAAAAPTLPVLLVHGLWSNKFIWEDLGFNFWKNLTKAGFPTWEFDYSGTTARLFDPNGKFVQVVYPPTGKPYNIPVTPGSTEGSIVEYSGALGEAVRTVSKMSGGSKINIVAHSMGGLLARYYLQYGGGDNDKLVNKLIMLGTPNQGSYFAKLKEEYDTLRDGVKGFFGGNIQGTTSILQMAPGSDFLSLLNNGGTQVRVQPAGGQKISATASYFTFAGMNPGSTTTGPYSEKKLVNLELAGAKILKVAANDGIVWVLFASVNNAAVVNHPAFAVGHIGLTRDGTVFAVVVKDLKDDPPLPSGNPSFDRDQQPLPLEAPWIHATISAGGSATRSVLVTDANSTAFFLTWDHGSINFTLVSPSGSIVNPSTPGIFYGNGTGFADNWYLVDAGFASYVIDAPVQGVWRANLSSSQAANYTLMTFMQGPLNMSLFSGHKLFFQTGQTELIGASITNGTSPVLGLSVSANITRPDGSKRSMSLFDSANNGTYANTFTDTSLAGFYALTVTASGTLGGVMLVRSQLSDFSVDFLPDLTIQSLMVDSTSYRIVTSNIGTQNEPNATLFLTVGYENGTTSQIGFFVFPLNLNSSHEVTGNLPSSGSGIYSFSAILVTSASPDLDPTNNLVVVILPFGGGGSARPPLRL